jgi:phage tail sheath protein FI
MAQLWDLFLAHAGADTRDAERLYDTLAGRARVFLDSKCLLLGDDWDQELSRAQRNSLVTIVLISELSEHAYYEREEIAQAIAMARRDPTKHRVVPVFLDRTAASRDEIPYGLRLKHGVSVRDAGGFAGLANRLLTLLDRIRDPSADTTAVQGVAQAGSSTTTAGFVGPTARGPTRPYLITTWAEYRQVFGDALSSDTTFMAHAVQGFFQNGGGRAYIARVLGKGATSASACVEPDDGQDTMCFHARSPGAWGNHLAVRVQDGTRAGIRITISNRQDVGDSGQPAEDFDNLALEGDGPNFALQIVNDNSRWVVCSALTLRSGFSPRPVLLTLVGGSDGAPLTADDYCGGRSLPEQETGLSALAKVEDVALLCLPDHVHPVIPAHDREVIAKEMVNQCECLQDRFAILSVEGGRGDVAAIRPFRDTAFAALYYPWIRIEDPVLQRGVWVPPVGHIAGIFARGDLAVGIHRSPEDQQVRGVSHAHGDKAVEFDLGPDHLDTLNRMGVNAICDLGKERGVHVVSALTMSIDVRQQSINARRFLSFVEASILRGTAWARFEVNDERLWATIVHDIQTFLKSLWEVGALSGSTPEEAYLVKCDRTTMTSDDIDNGRAVVVVGLSMPGGATPRVLAIQTAGNEMTTR